MSTALRLTFTVRDSVTTRRRIISTSEGVLTLWERLRLVRGGAAWCLVEASLSPSTHA
jgi:hypothetical protein